MPEPRPVQPRSARRAAAGAGGRHGRRPAADLGYTVNALVDGAYAGDYFQGGDKIDLTIIGERAVTSSGRRTSQRCRSPRPAANWCRWRRWPTIELASGPEQINHRERQRAITIAVSPPPEMPLEDAMDESSAAKSSSRCMTDRRNSAASTPDRSAGTADKLRDTWQALRWNVLLALLITYLLMAALFESWLYPLVIILSVPLGAVGGLLGLKLLNLVSDLAWRAAPDARRADHAGLRDPDRHRGQQRDPDRAPVAQPHARRRHGPRRRDPGKRPHAHSPDLHDHLDHRAWACCRWCSFPGPAANSTAAWAASCWAA